MRLIGDRGSIFEIDLNTKNTFYYIASQGVPIRLRTTRPGTRKSITGRRRSSPARTSSRSVRRTTRRRTDAVLVDQLQGRGHAVHQRPGLVGAFKTKFDKYWHDTDPEPESLIPTAPYFKNWDDACATEPACSDYSHPVSRPDADGHQHGAARGRTTRCRPRSSGAGARHSTTGLVSTKSTRSRRQSISSSTG